MDHSLLPIDVCEVIVDSCERSFQGYRTLRACALTCTAWLPRSRLNLYHSAKVIGPRTLELLLQTLRTHRHLCGFVRELEVGAGPEDAYVPFVQPFIVQNLRNLERVTLWLDWDGYPPQFQRFVAHLRIRTLRLFGTFRSTRDLFQLVWALKDLRSLVLDCTIRNDVPALDCVATARSCSANLCGCLTELSLRFSGARAIANFPPRDAFGRSVAHLKLHFDRAPSPDDVALFASLMGCISSFAALETLEITDVLGGSTHVGLTCKSGFFAALLDSVRADALFHSLHLHLLSYQDYQPAPLFDDVLTDEVRAPLGRLPALVQFGLTVECASVGQDVVQDLSSALRRWFSTPGLTAEVCHSRAAAHGVTLAHWICTRRLSSQVAVTPL